MQYPVYRVPGYLCLIHGLVTIVHKHTLLLCPTFCLLGCRLWPAIVAYRCASNTNG